MFLHQISYKLKKKEKKKREYVPISKNSDRIWMSRNCYAQNLSLARCKGGVLPLFDFSNLTCMTWSIKLFWRGSDIKNLIPLIIKSYWICDRYIWHSNFSNQDNDFLSLSELFDARKCRISDIINYNESQEYELSYWYMYTEVNRIFDKKKICKINDILDMIRRWNFVKKKKIIFWNEKLRFWDQKILFWYSNFFFSEDIFLIFHR